MYTLSRGTWSALSDCLRTADYLSVFKPIEIIAQNIQQLLPTRGLAYR
jgi:hypothetical protein